MPAERPVFVEVEASTPTSVGIQNIFIPMHTVQHYTSNRYHRTRILITPDAGYDFANENFNIGVENGDQFVFQRPYADSLLTPSIVNGYLTKTKGRMFGEDSQIIHEMDGTTKELMANSPVKGGGAWGEFRFKLGFVHGPTVADDLGHKGVLLAKMKGKKGKLGEQVLIIELRGRDIIPLPDEKAAKNDDDIVCEEFEMPDEEPKGVKGDLSQAAFFLEYLFKEGKQLSEIKHSLESMGIKDMEVDGLYEEYKNKKKRAV